MRVRTDLMEKSLLFIIGNTEISPLAPLSLRSVEMTSYKIYETGSRILHLCDTSSYITHSGKNALI